MLRIGTWNVNSLRVRLPHVLQWLESEQPDVLALQETKLTNENFPVEEIHNAGYQVIFSGQKTYNGVATLSKTKATNVITDFPGFDDPQRRILCTNIDNVAILNLYIPNGSEVGSDKYRYKLEWLSHLQNFTDTLVNRYENVVLLGDFNIAEPGALIGFAGPRVVKETIGKDLPEGFQTSEFVLEHGFLDLIIERKELKNTISQLIKMVGKPVAAETSTEETTEV